MNTPDKVKEIKQWIGENIPCFPNSESELISILYDFLQSQQNQDKDYCTCKNPVYKPPSKLFPNPERICGGCKKLAYVEYKKRLSQQNQEGEGWILIENKMPQLHEYVLLVNMDGESRNWTVDFIHEYALTTQKYPKNWTHWRLLSDIIPLIKSNTPKTEETGSEGKEVRIKYFNPDTDEVEYGTLISQNVLYYKVIPDDHVLPEVKWRKRYCDIESNQ